MKKPFQKLLLVLPVLLLAPLDTHAQSSSEMVGPARLKLERELLVSVDRARTDETQLDGFLPVRELVIQPGENVSQALERAHVLPNATALHLTQQANPLVADMSRLQPGERLMVPSIQDYQVPAGSGGALVRFIDPGREKVSSDLSKRIRVLAREVDRDDLRYLADDLEAKAYRLSSDELDTFAARSWQAITEFRSQGSDSQVDPLKSAMTASLGSGSARKEIRVRTTSQGTPRCHVLVWYSLARPGSQPEHFREFSKPIARASLPRGNYKLGDSIESLARPDAFRLSVSSTDSPDGIDVDLEVNPTARECSP